MSDPRCRTNFRFHGFTSRFFHGATAFRLAVLCALTISLSVVFAEDERGQRAPASVVQLQSRTDVVSPGSAAARELMESRVDAGVFEEMRASANGKAYVIVMLRPPAARGPMPEAQRLAAIKATQDAVIGRFAAAEFTPRYQYKTFPGFTGLVDAAGLAKLGVDPDVVSITADAEVQAVLTQSVPHINADQVHGLGITGAGVTVAVLDTGIDKNHADISDNVAAGDWHFLDQGVLTGPGGQDDNGHGTNVAGIITSKGVVAAVGVAPDADILSVKVLKADGSGWLSDWVAGIDYVVANRANYGDLCAINMSLSTTATYSQCPCDTVFPAAQASILAAKNVGIATFVASSNDGLCGRMGAPACLSAAFSVAATYDPGDFQPNDQITSFSNRNACTDLSAPGNFITAPGWPGGGLSTYQGTSQATPHVAGVAALMCQKCIGFRDPDSMVAIMKATGVATTDPTCGFTPPRVDALAAVSRMNEICIEEVKFSQRPYCECKADIDKDGVVTSFDLAVIAGCAGGDCSGCFDNSCDVDCDGDVDSDDAAAALCLFQNFQPDVCCPPFQGEDIESNVDWVDMQPNVVVADDFTSDGRPITGVRWWGSVLKEPCDKPAIAGDDCWSTACDGNTVVEFGGPIIAALPADFFGPGSDPFTGLVSFGGQTGFADTVISRLDDMCLDGALPDTDHTRIQILQLELKSCTPVIVTHNGGQNPVQFDLYVSVINQPQPVGDLWATKTNVNGGTFDSVLPIEPGFAFAPAGGPPPPPFAFAFFGQILTLNSFSSPWVQSEPLFAICGLGGGFFPGFDKNQDTCCPETCHRGPAPGHDHCVTPPKCPKCPPQGGDPTDDCDSKPTVSEGSFSFSNLGATTDGPPAPCAPLDADVWVNYVPTCSGTATIDTCVANFDTVLEVFSGCSCSPTGPVVACNDDTFSGPCAGTLQSLVSFPVIAGECFKVRIGGFGGDQGTGTLNISCSSPATDSVGVAPDTAQTGGIPGDKCAPPGVDGFTTLCDPQNPTRFDFSQTPIPADFFFPGSPPFTGVVDFGGPQEFPADTIIQRLDQMCFDGPLPVEQTIPIQIVQLDLISCAPIDVGADLPYDVFVSLAGPQPVGSMTATKTTPTGGTYTASLPVTAQFSFQQVGGLGPILGPVLAPPITLQTDPPGFWLQDCCDTGVGSEGFFPGWKDDKEGFTKPCCKPTCHPDPAGGHEHCVWPPDCPPCPDKPPPPPPPGDLNWDGWFISFHLPEGDVIAGDQFEPLALYYCDEEFVDILPTPLPACDGHPVEEYRVDLGDCCLVHANVDPRSGSIPAAKEAFFEDKCSEYLIDIEAVVGHEFVQDPDTLECIEFPTGKTLDGPFWGWHTAPRDCGIHPAIETSVKMGGLFVCENDPFRLCTTDADCPACDGGANAGAACDSNADCPSGTCIFGASPCVGVPPVDWLYGPWSPVVPVCSLPNMAFELLTLTPSDAPDCNHNWIPDQCEPDCQPNGIPDDCDINGGGSLDNNGNGIPDECECFLSSPPSIKQIPDAGGTLRDNKKGRFLPVVLNDPGRDVAIQVEFVSLPAPYDLWNGTKMFARAPMNICETSTLTQVPPAPCLAPTYAISKLECTGAPFFTDFESLGVINLWHEGIVPGGFYDVRVIDSTCNPTLAASYSNPTTMETASFGNTVGLGGFQFPVDPLLISIDDALAGIASFANALNKTSKSRTELASACIDNSANIDDVLMSLSGFSGGNHPQTPGSADACASSCPDP